MKIITSIGNQSGIGIVSDRDFNHLLMSPSV
jgi:hypothetical protein